MSRRALLEAIAYGDDRAVSPRDRLHALELLQTEFGAENAADEGLSEDEILAEADSFHSMMLAAMFVASGTEREVDPTAFPRTAQALRSTVGMMTELAIDARDLAAKHKRGRHEPERRDDVIDADAVDVPEPAHVDALPSAAPVRELPPGIDLAAGWPRPPGPGFAAPRR